MAKQEHAKLSCHAARRTLLTPSALPAFDGTGNLPPGIYQVSTQEIISRFCQGEVREHWGHVLQEILGLARSTEQLEAVYIFGSFVTAKTAPADLDLFLVMSSDFSSNAVEGRARLVFDRSRAAIVWGSCIYWITARTDRAPFLAAWQLRRDGGQRGIVEVQW
jgi:hypothetical protein